MVGFSAMPVWQSRLAKRTALKTHKATDSSRSRPRSRCSTQPASSSRPVPCVSASSRIALKPPAPTSPPVASSASSTRWTETPAALSLGHPRHPRRQAQHAAPRQGRLDKSFSVPIFLVQRKARMEHIEAHRWIGTRLMEPAHPPGPNQLSPSPEGGLFSAGSLGSRTGVAGSLASIRATGIVHAVVLAAAASVISKYGVSERARFSAVAAEAEKTSGLALIRAPDVHLRRLDTLEHCRCRRANGRLGHVPDRSGRYGLDRGQEDYSNRQHHENRQHHQDPGFHRNLPFHLKIRDSDLQGSECGTRSGPTALLPRRKASISLGASGSRIAARWRTRGDLRVSNRSRTGRVSGKVVHRTPVAIGAPWFPG